MSGDSKIDAAAPYRKLSVSMKRTLLLSAGWILAAGAVYASALLLDLYWNLFEWKPRLDGSVAGILSLGAVALVATWALSGRSNYRVTKVISLIACLGLLAVAAYA